MKTSIILLSFFTMLLFSGCKKDEDQQYYNEIYKRWEWESTSYSFSPDILNDRKLLTPELIGENYSVDITKNNRIKFYKNNKLLFASNFKIKKFIVGSNIYYILDLRKKNDYQIKSIKLTYLIGKMTIDQFPFINYKSIDEAFYDAIHNVYQ